jgi:two-component system, sensor histidine kinase and response regulator
MKKRQEKRMRWFSVSSLFVFLALFFFSCTLLISKMLEHHAAEGYAKSSQRALHELTLIEIENRNFFEKAHAQKSVQGEERSKLLSSLQSLENLVSFNPLLVGQIDKLKEIVSHNLLQASNGNLVVKSSEILRQLQLELEALVFEYQHLMEVGSRSIRASAISMVIAALLLLCSGVWVVWQLHIEKQRTSFALRKSEEEFRNLVQFAAVGISKVDLQGKYEYVSGHWLRLTGLNGDDVLKKGTRPRVHPEDEKKLAEAWDHAFREGRALEIEYRIIRPDDSVVWVRKHAEPLKDLGGTVTGYLGVLQEVSAAKELEATLRDAHRQAIDAAEMKSRFLANMSHEIRTPMNGVIGMTSLLGNTTLDSEQQDYVDSIRASGKALMAIIDDILDYSKLEANKVQIEFSPFELRRVIEEAVDMFAALSDSKGVLLSNMVDPGIPAQVVGDPNRFRQVLANLVSNGMKFTQSGEVVVQAKLINLRDSVSIRFSVSDTGIGLTDVQIRRLFQPFSQADNTTTRRFGGTGLGLSICKELVEKMGGRIGVESRPGKGSTFWFELSFGIQSSVQVSRIAVASERVVCFSDNPFFRERVKELLDARGYRHVTFVSLRELSKEWVCANERAVSIVDLGSLGEQSPISAELQSVLNTMTRALVFVSSRSRGLIAENSSILMLPIPLLQSELYKRLSFLVGEPKPKEKSASIIGTPSSERVGPPARVLVAEDSTINQKVIARMLEKLGYESDLVENGAEAFESAKQFRYDAVLMDCQMPVMDGFEATRKIRALDGYRGTPIIALTANVLDSAAEKCQAAGMDHFLSKPLQIESLKELLDKLPARRVSHLDEQVMLSLRSLNQPGKPDLVCELAGIFLDIAPSIVDELFQAVRAGNGTKARSLAHKLKGSSHHIGAFGMASICADIEAMSDKVELSWALNQVTQLEREFDRVKAELKMRVADAA